MAAMNVPDDPREPDPQEEIARRESESESEHQSDVRQGPPRRPSQSQRQTDEQLRLELERFMREIDLGKFAHHRLHLRPQGGRARPYPMPPDTYYRYGEVGDQIVIRSPRRSSTGLSPKAARNAPFYVWINPENTTERGTIVELVQRKRGMNLGQVRDWLREELGLPSPGAAAASNDAPPPSADAASVAASEPRSYAAIRAVYNAAQVVAMPDYLAMRGLRPETLTDPRFSGTFRVQTGSGEILFPHRNSDGICGVERKFTNGRSLFVKGSTRGLWCSNWSPTDTTIVIGEAAIDVMSYHQLFPEPTARYMAPSGNLNDHQMELLSKAMARLPRDGRVVIATDNDFHRLVDFMTAHGGWSPDFHGLAEGGTYVHVFSRFDRSYPIAVLAQASGTDFECKRISRAELHTVVEDCSAGAPSIWTSLAAPALSLPELFEKEGLVKPETIPWPNNPGRTYAHKIGAMAAADHPSLTVEAALLPPAYKDWNDVLKVREHEFVREARLARSRERCL
jgi:hypothetical protein